ncbi:MAG: flavodoxin [Alteromonadaceae bacterium]|nr:MAG: flavodoxin [Alteromonadaceae bacterium]
MHSSPSIGLFYGSSTCYTEIVSEKISQIIKELLGEDCVQLHNIADESLAKAQGFKYLIMGIPTWDYGELQEDWEEVWPELNELQLSQTKVALFGLGDQVGYPEWFLDAMGYLHQQLQIRDAKMVGYWPVDTYKFDASQALTADKTQFLGLALDEENEFDLSDQRIRTWCTQVLQEFGLLGND